jgi:acyl-coenzyme A synthetase/AMP-(fatty) acid ligase
VADEKKISAEEIAQWVDGQVANHKRLRGGVLFIPVVPRSPAGKILRKVLRDAARKEEESVQKKKVHARL